MASESNPNAKVLSNLISVGDVGSFRDALFVPGSAHTVVAGMVPEACICGLGLRRGFRPVRSGRPSLADRSGRWEERPPAYSRSQEWPRTLPLSRRSKDPQAVLGLLVRLRAAPFRMLARIEREQFPCRAEAWAPLFLRTLNFLARVGTMTLAE